MWNEIEKLLSDSKMGEELIFAIKKLHKERTQSSEARKRSEKIRQLTCQMEVLAERLSELPKSISPLAIFKQMERLRIKSEEDKLAALRAKEFTSDPPSNLESYKELLFGLRQMAQILRDTLRETASLDRLSIKSKSQKMDLKFIFT